MKISKKMTPLQKQYMEIKQRHQDCLLLFRMGDFYETFDDDAVTCSKALGIALAKRQGQDLAGVPYHALDKYLPILIKKGFKVAICEQVEDPKTKTGKIVKREVTRIITPGTVYENDLLDDKVNNFIFCITTAKKNIGIAFIDFSTGEFLVTELKKIDFLGQILNLLHKFNPAECLLPINLFEDKELYGSLKKEFPNIFITTINDYHFEFENAYEELISHFKTTSLDGFGVEEFKIGIQAAGAILSYLKNMQKSSLKNLIKITPYYSASYMNLDVATQKNLEITQNIVDGGLKGSLLEIFDNTASPMGARLLRKWIIQPLTIIEKIQQRQDAVEELFQDVFKRQEIREILSQIFDIERLISKVSYGNANGRDLLTLKNSLVKIKELKKIGQFNSELLIESIKKITDLPEVIELIDKNIKDDCPITIKEGGIIKKGINSELDELREIQKNSKQWILNLESEERKKTKIKNLKIKYNKVFGYFIEVTKANSKDVPDRYIRKQTLVNAERYIVPELKDFEVKILSADEKIKNIEYELFIDIRRKVAEKVEEIQETARSVAIFDVISTFAEVAKLNNYVKPIVNGRSKIEIIEGRHPVVEKISGSQKFIPNDTYMDSNENLVIILTGPNMAGKSTYIRQIALITLMAQIGSFVPAKRAVIGIVDRIFSRVGAFDDISRQRSTFMVEMNETANILNNATKRSLIILDELGRGTSTFDGLSIAWSVVEHIHNETKAKTLFATHYHQLCQIENYLPGVKNYHIQIKEQGNEMIFLRKITRGGSDKSFGIEVAKLAGIPSPVIERAQKILKKLEAGDPIQHPTVKKYPTQKIRRNKKASEGTTKKIIQKSLLD
ncbi:MAG: DNA mismatch repair protein MutS [Candidatus Helarchaeota archaeon]